MTDSKSTEGSTSSLEEDEVVEQQPVFINDKIIATFISSHAEHVRDWIDQVELVNDTNGLRLIVGLDIKLGAPLAVTGHRPVALLLLFVHRTCLIYELTYADKIPTSLYQFLSDRRCNTFVGVGMQSKMLQLTKEFGLGVGARWLDLGTLTAERYNRPELSDASVSQLRTFLHGADVARLWQEEEVDRWDEAELSYEHVRHACIDAYTCYELGSFLVYPIPRFTPD